MRKIAIIFFVTLLQLSVQSQNPESQNGIIPSIELNYLHGSVKNPIAIPNQSNAHYIQLSITNATGTQSQSFFNNYKKPNVGATAICGFLGSKEVLGNMYSLYPTWKYTFFNSKKIGVNIMLGTGLAYFTNPSDKITNPTNHIIGSHINNITEISPSLWFKFTDKMFIQTGVSYLHFSNGHTAIPNIGLNDFTVKIGAVYKPGALVGLKTHQRKAVVKDSIWRKSLSVSYGRHKLAYAVTPVDGPTYSIYKAAGYITKQINTIHELQLGLSLTYYNSYYSFIRFEDYYKYLKIPRSTVTTVHIGHEFLLNRFGFVTELGFKVFDPFYRSFFLKNAAFKDVWTNSLITTRIGFKAYPFTNSFAGKKVAMGMYIKTNFVQADFVEYSLSYSF